MDEVQQFASLFEGRHDAFGTDEGGCLRVNPDNHTAALENHLFGRMPIGVYPMVPQVQDGHEFGHVVKWGCVDLDVRREGKRRYDYETEAEAHIAAVNLVGALRGSGVPGYIERTRSRGRHVWVFSARWLAARDVRRALLVACEIAGVPPTEVNPKSEELAEGQLGNYVRLPFPGALGEGIGSVNQYMRGDQAMIREDQTQYGFDGFMDVVEQTEPEALEYLASYWTPPETPSVALGAPAELDRDLTTKLGGLAYQKLTEGPLDRLLDRSSWLYGLACLCAEDGLEPEEALAVVTQADECWTRKYVDRRDGERQLAKSVERAYERTST